MSVYVIGDVQGCDGELARLLDQIAFNPGVDTAFFLGDLVNRGPQSLQVLRRISRMGSSARSVLGNHDLHALAVFHGVRLAGKRDTLSDLLTAPDAGALFSWMAGLPLAEQTGSTLLVHAGVLPSWDATKVIALSAYFKLAMSQNGVKNTLLPLFGDSPVAWSEQLPPDDAIRVVVNAMTRVRICTPLGAMALNFKGAPHEVPAGHLPWFSAPNRQTAHTRIAFGHWSRLGLHQTPTLLGLDTGCAWGGQLTAAQLHPDDSVTFHQVSSNRPAA